MLELPKVYVDMTGRGELWVGANGFPLRQQMTLNFPEREDNYLPSTDIQADFFDFAPLPTLGLLGRAGGMLASALGAATQSGSILAMLTVLLSAVFAAALVLNRRARVVYAGVAITVILSMVATPLLTNNRVLAFSVTQAERQSESKARQAEAEMQTEMRQQLKEPTVDPHTDPLATAQALAAAQDTIAKPKYFDESCISDPYGDQDGDALTNLQECLLGTLPTSPDTDADLVSDNVEVAGFQLNGAGVTWYTDPLNPDTNRDGLDDGSEWYTDVGEDATPPDTDGNGVPDLWDIDNDGDGAPDEYDISPYSSSQDIAPFDEAAPFQLDMQELMTDKLVKVQFQLRPSDVDHLWLSNNVLDWPDGDNDGQIQDVDGATFFDVDPSLLASPNDNGDMRLAPMLEIVIAGTPHNLPSEDLLEQFSIVVQQLDETTQIAYVPLQLVTDDTGAKNVAFGGTMFYRAAETWGNPQSVSLVWMVQALLDQCQTAADGVCTEYLYNQEGVIHVYDDAWYLTGLLVTEEHDAQIALVNEDSVETANIEAGYDQPFYVDGLYGLTHGLNQTFLAPADCDSLDGNGECVGDGQLDITVDEIVRRFDHAANNGVSAEERWNLPDIFDVGKVGTAVVEWD